MWGAGEEPTELGYDPDRIVKVSIGRLVKALADAVDAAKEEDSETKWKRGDRAFVEVEVSDSSGNHVNVTVVGRAVPRAFIVRDDLLIPKVT